MTISNTVHANSIYHAAQHPKKGATPSHFLVVFYSSDMSRSPMYCQLW